ncbi:MAG: hypothetical protein FWE74_01780 [Oscillospiraceae bacterium]|nr:hypothetical protein [Oscillospiraceae bacterium]
MKNDLKKNKNTGKIKVAILTTPYSDIKSFCKRASVPADALVRLERT